MDVLAAGWLAMTPLPSPDRPPARVP